MTHPPTIFAARLAAILLCLASALGAEPHPNILLILADDLGVGDVAALAPGSKIPTPHLDRLVREGRHFNNAYCPVSVCSPTRYALMTGRYPSRSWKTQGVLGNWERPMIEDGIVTLPAMLHGAGYATAGFGKWHLGARYRTTDGKPPLGQGKFKSPGSGLNLDLAAPIAGGPLDRGFEIWNGFICASEMLVFEGNNATAVLEHELYPPLKTPGIERLQVVPLRDYSGVITARSVAFLRGRAAAKDRPFFCYHAPYVPHIPLVVRDEFRGKSGAGDYGDYVHQLDHEVGLLLAALDETGLAASTLVIFASDNGSQFVTTGDGHRPNGSLRGTKHLLWEGGVRTPLILRWPGHVPAGTSSTRLVALLDVMPALAALTGIKMPSGAAVDGLDVSPLWLGKSDAPIRERVILTDGGRRHAIRAGDWKYVQPAKPGDVGELYDLANDPAEEHNLAAREPGRARQLADELSAELAQHRAGAPSGKGHLPAKP